MYPESYSAYRPGHRNSFMVLFLTFLSQFATIIDVHGGTEKRGHFFYSSRVKKLYDLVILDKEHRRRIDG